MTNTLKILIILLAVTAVGAMVIFLSRGAVTDIMANNLEIQEMEE